MNIAIYCASANEELLCENLSRKLQLPIIYHLSRLYDFYLCYQDKKLMLQSSGSIFKKPFYIDFFAASLDYRLQRASKNNELLARAIGLKKTMQPVVFDATAGLGRDAMVLAHLGCEVVMCERSPVLCALIEDGLQRARQNTEWKKNNLVLMPEDGKVVLSALAPDNYPEVIYLDPMYPARSKSALVKKEMRLLRALVGDDNDAEELFFIALYTAKNRVVVKRPGYAGPIAGRMPDFVIEGSQQRFDVYQKNTSCVPLSNLL